MQTWRILIGLVRCRRERRIYSHTVGWHLQDLRAVALTYKPGRLLSEPAPGVRSDPEILGGVLVFVGTRVPVRALVDCLEHGHQLGEFLDDFPTVTREQAAVLERVKRLAVDAASAR